MEAAMRSCYFPGLLVLLSAASASAAIPKISRDQIISIAKSGVGCPYVWGGTCWDPSNKNWKGADCSGYVTVCWQIPKASKTTDCLPHYYTTSTYKSSSTHWTSISRDNLQKADALVYNSGSAGHIILWASGNKWGNAQVYEARGSAYGIVYRTKNVDSKYVARRRHSLVAPVTYPQMTIASSIVSISGQSRDFCKQGKSAGIFDWRRGQTTTARIDVKNSGTEKAQNVEVGIWAEEPYVEITSWNIYTNWKQGGSFVLNDTDAMQSMPHESPGKSFTLNLGGIAPGETKRVKLKVAARLFSVGAVDHPDVRGWIKSVDGYYSKKDFHAPFDNVKGYQKQNGGDLRAYTQTDVLDQETCDQKDNDCDGKIDEDDVCTAPEPDAGVDPPPAQRTDGGTAPLPPVVNRPRVAGELHGSCAAAPGAARSAASPGLVLLLLALALCWRAR
jgi:hypothetical protein